jgi:hypothetical protein
MVRYGSVGGQGSASRLLVHIGMALATLAFAAWWTTHTILDTGRTQRVASAVLENTDLRHYLAGQIAPFVARADTTNPQAKAVVQQRLTTVLDRPHVRAKLERFVGEAHARLVGERATPAVLDKATVDTLVAAALPNMTAAEIAKIPAVKVDVPQVAAFNTARRAFHDRTGLYLLGAVVALALALVVTRDRRSTLRLVGRWLIGISVGHLLVLWVVPVLVVPAVTHNPWAGLVAAVARALNAGVVTGLVVFAAAGVAFLVLDLFVPAVNPAPVPVSPEG